MTTELPACGRCGSTALHHVVHGMPTHDVFEAEQPTNEGSAPPPPPPSAWRWVSPGMSSAPSDASDITFDRPHAVVAIARGAAWEGVPLFHGWIAPD